MPAASTASSVRSNAASASVGKPTITSVVTLTWGTARLSAAIALEVLVGVVVAAHRLEHRVVAGLHRDVQVRAHLGLGGERLEQRVLDVDHLDARQPHPLDARHLRHRHHQLAELEPVLGIAVVADADPGHHHLGLALRDPPAGLVEDGARRARAGAAPDGGDDAVGAVAVAAVLDLDEAAGASDCAGAWPPAAGPGERRARTSCSRSAHAPRPAAIAPGHLLGGAHERLTRASISANCAPFRLTAQPATRTRSARPQRAPDRLARLRLGLAGDAARVDHVQLGLVLGGLGWPAASSACRASIASAWETLQPRNLTANDATVAAR